MSDAQNPGGWPDASKPGYPKDPERDGRHWFKRPDGELTICWWLTARPPIVQSPIWLHAPWAQPEHFAQEVGWEYLGPCHTPAEVAAQVEAARREEREAPREIAMGHGLVDVTVCNHEGRYCLVLKPRDHYVPVGQESAPLGSPVTLDRGCVAIWFDGPEFGDTIINAIQEAAAIRARGGA